MSVTDLDARGIREGLARREAEGRPVRVALIGAGRFGTTVAAGLGQMPGVRLSVICDLRQASRQMAARAGTSGDEGRVVQGVRAEAIVAGACCLTDDLSAALSAPVDVVVEATGRTEIAARVAMRAIEAGKHVVMVTVEADVLYGGALADRARRAGVVYTLADGDQPATTARMVDWARAAGYTIVAAGRGTRMHPADPTGIPEEAFARYGYDPEIVERRMFNPKMYNSFRDGSKAQIEMCALANATGLIPDRRGMHEPSAGVADLPRLFRPAAEGGLLSRTGVVELANAVAADGVSLLPDHLTNGVFVVVTTDEPLLNEDLAFYRLPASEDRRYAAFWRPYHLCGIETPMSVAEAVLFGRPTAAPSRRTVAEVLACAKRDLPAGAVLDGSGGALVRGQIDLVEIVAGEELLPLGWAEGVTLRRAIRAGEAIPLAAVDGLPTDELARLRTEHLALAGFGTVAGTR